MSAERFRCGPCDVDRRLVAGHEPLVRVDPLREHGGDLARVTELAGDERLADRREVPLVVGVVEELLRPPVKSDWWVCMPDRSPEEAASA